MAEHDFVVRILEGLAHGLLCVRDFIGDLAEFVAGLAQVARRVVHVFFERADRLAQRARRLGHALRADGEHGDNQDDNQLH